MDKSLEYIINASKDKSRVTLQNENWDNAKVINLKEYITSICATQDQIIGDIIESELGYTKVKIVFDDTVDFDYFTSVASTHDGTLIFTKEAINTLVTTLLYGGTYCKNEYNDGVIHNRGKYRFIYTVGNIVINSDFGMKDINGRKMLGQTDMVCIPIKFELEEIVI